MAVQTMLDCSDRRPIQKAATVSDVIITCLSDDDSVQQVFDKALSNQVLSANARFVACPVFGAPDRATMRRATDVAYVKMWFEDMMGRVMIDLGDQPPQAATTLKVIGNSFIFNMVEAVAERDVLAEKTGPVSAALHQYLQLFLPAIYTSYSRRIMTGDYWSRNLAMVLILLSKNVESKERDYRYDKMSFYPHKSR
ncbi:6-phosphogluconate dehydrogenase 2 [Penicillium canescens]|nr:6-phosphogluconate dehydrogenase 2 [Penicillium canescens]